MLTIGTFTKNICLCGKCKACRSEERELSILERKVLVDPLFSGSMTVRHTPSVKTLDQAATWLKENAKSDCVYEVWESYKGTLHQHLMM